MQVSTHFLHLDKYIAETLAQRFVNHSREVSFAQLSRLKFSEPSSR